MDINMIKDIFNAYRPELSFDEQERFSDILIEIERMVNDRINNTPENAPRMIFPEEILLESLLKNLMGLPRVQSSVSYAPLYAKLHEYRISFTDLCDAAAVTDGQRLMIGYGLPMHMRYLMNIAVLLECEAKDLFYEINVEEHRKKVLRGRQIARSKNQFRKLIDDQIVYQTEKDLKEYRKNNKGEDDGTEAFFADGVYLNQDTTLDSLEKLLGMRNSQAE